MSVTYDYKIDGRDDAETLKTLKKKIGQLATRTSKNYCVGKASGENKPEARWNQKYKPRGYAKMIVICQTSTIEEALALETKLIAYFKDKCDDRLIDNPIGGGGGRAGSNPGYVYLVLSEEPSGCSIS